MLVKIKKIGSSIDLEALENPSLITKKQYKELKEQHEKMKSLIGKTIEANTCGCHHYFSAGGCNWNREDLEIIKY